MKCFGLSSSGSPCGPVDDIRSDFDLFRTEVFLEVKCVPKRRSVPNDVRPPLSQCEMPLSDRVDSCADCRSLGPVMNCPSLGHMPLCGSPDIWVACHI